MATFAGFLKNMGTQEEFVAPVTADNRNQALFRLQEAYPQPAFSLLTCYETDRLEKILADMKRWPGVASTVQPSLEETLSRVTARVGKLPPLVREQPSAGRVQHTVQPAEVDAMMRLMSEQRRLREARLASALSGEKVAKPVAVDARAAAQAAPVAPASNVAAPATPTATIPARNQGKSVVELLRAMRG